ncbi:MAG TPA: TIGR01777 family oxidoreductase [Candidatus Dormibacteraeota bacterium]|nr:TIGR01777 family oxidoreductase [Candidatus Dormibacteraeota bacterium]
MRVALLGGSGFIGDALAAALRARGDDVTVLSLRDPEHAADGATDCEAIVNLAGEPIAQRWTAAVKQRLHDSRTVLPRAFLQHLARLQRRATVYVSASAIDYYGPSATATFDESSPAGKTFLAGICAAWEREAQGASALGMRVACIRTGLALGKGGMLAKLVPLFRAGMGGRIGDGTSWYSWIHADDLAGIYLSAIDDPDGALNAVAPNPVTNAEFVRELGRALHRPAFLPAPTFALRAALGEGANVLLERQRVLPRRALERGYRFKFPELAGALEDVVR